MTKTTIRYVIPFTILVLILPGCGAGRDATTDGPGHSIPDALPFIDADRNGIHDNAENLWQAFLLFNEQTATATHIQTVSSLLSTPLREKTTDPAFGDFYLTLIKAYAQGEPRYIYSIQNEEGAKLLVRLTKGIKLGISSVSFVREDSQWKWNGLYVGDNRLTPGLWQPANDILTDASGTLARGEIQLNVAGSLSYRLVGKQKISIAVFDHPMDAETFRAQRFPLPIIDALATAQLEKSGNSQSTGEIATIGIVVEEDDRGDVTPLRVCLDRVNAQSGYTSHQACSDQAAALSVLHRPTPTELRATLSGELDDFSTAISLHNTLLDTYIFE